MSENEKLIIHLVETPQCCFITDCVKSSGYDYNYHQSKIEALYFDGEHPESTFAKNWMKIKGVPQRVERKISGERTNRRYELIDPDMASGKLPNVILAADKDEYSEGVLDSLYKYVYDTLPTRMEPVEVEFKTILKMEEYEEPSFGFDGVHKFDYKDSVYKISSVDLEHQLFDKMIFPEVCLAHRPCSLSSKQVYDITRQYVLSHINNAVSEITSNYDFCFTVQKRVPKIEPETISYQNIFARTKKERSKIKTSVKSFSTYEIFQMTHSQSNYQGYTAIPAMYASSEKELSEKMDEWLTTLIHLINTPIQECPHCKGTGFIGDIEVVKHSVFKEISDRK